MPPTRSLVSHKIDDSICADQFAIVVRSHRLARSFDPCCVSELHTSNRPAGAITEKLVPRLKASGYPQACVVTAVAIHPHSGMSSESENTIASAAQFGETPFRFATGSGHVDNVLYPAAGCSSNEMPTRRRPRQRPRRLFLRHSSHRCLLRMRSEFRLFVVWTHQEEDRMGETVMP